MAVKMHVWYVVQFLTPLAIWCVGLGVSALVAVATMSPEAPAFISTQRSVVRYHASVSKAESIEIMAYSGNTGTGSVPRQQMMHVPSNTAYKHGTNKPCACTRHVQHACMCVVCQACISYMC